jgi:exo-beta-1,3-glucanase (GH17 family)
MTPLPLVSALRQFLLLIAVVCVSAPLPLHAQATPPANLLERLAAAPETRLIAYTPSTIDPRWPENNRTAPTSALRADLEVLRPTFDGLVLYGYHEASTPRIAALARELGFEVLVLGIWDVRSAAEIDGVAALARQFSAEMTVAICVGNEGITFGRYEPDDVKFASERLRGEVPDSVLLTTSEPLVGYRSEFVLGFGDFLFPNIHPAWDRPALAPPEAVEWVRQEATRLTEESAKCVLVKETGLPHAHKHDNTPEYTPELQAQFWTAYVAAGLQQSVAGAPRLWTGHNVAFEAFDLPWKAEASGHATEQAWGLFSTERQPHPALEAWQRQ